MDPKNICLPGWELGEELGKGGFGSVYKIRRDTLGHVETCAMKVMQIPRDRSEIEFLRLSGMDDRSITEHLKSQVKSFMDEYNIMLKLQDNPHIVHSYDFQHIPHKDQLSWTILIRMELLTPLMKRMDAVSTEPQIIQLGLDLCDALIACQKKSIIHRDIKPQNIFIAETGHFKLGDFGISKVTSDASQAKTQVGTLTFMAPEIAAGKKYDATVDIYSLGLVLYWLLNKRRGPFLPLPPAVPNFSQNQEALARRIAGEPLNAPLEGSAPLKAVILKACSFRPEDRYADAHQMRDALRSLRQRETPPPPPEKPTYYLCSQHFTGGSEYRFFRDLDKIGYATCTTSGPSPLLDIHMGSLHWHNNWIPDADFLTLTDATGKVRSKVFGYQNNTCTIDLDGTGYRVQKTAGGWAFFLLTKLLAVLERINPDQQIWTAAQKSCYFDPMTDRKPTCRMRSEVPLTPEQVALFLSYPLLEHPAPVQSHIAQGTRKEVFYMDDDHNYVSPDKATIRVIRILDENGKLLQEIWQVRDKNETDQISDDEDTVALKFNLIHLGDRDVDCSSLIPQFINLDQTDSKVVLELVRRTGEILGFSNDLQAAEVVHYRLQTGYFPDQYHQDISQFKNQLKNQLAVQQAPELCLISGQQIDLRRIKQELLLADRDDVTTGQLLKKLLQITHLKQPAHAEELAAIMVATGKVPAKYAPQGPGAYGSDLDIYGTLELKHQPSKKERVQTLTIEGQKVTLTLDSGILPNEKRYTVKGAGKTDPATGHTGDAHVNVICKAIFRRWNTLWNIILNLFILVFMALYAVFSLVKALFTTKVGWVIIAIGTAIFLALRYFRIL